LPASGYRLAVPFSDSDHDRHSSPAEPFSEADRTAVPPDGATSQETPPDDAEAVALRESRPREFVWPPPENDDVEWVDLESKDRLDTPERGVFWRPHTEAADDTPPPDEAPAEEVAPKVSEESFSSIDGELSGEEPGVPADDAPVSSIPSDDAGMRDDAGERMRAAHDFRSDAAQPVFDEPLPSSFDDSFPDVDAPTFGRDATVAEPPAPANRVRGRAWPRVRPERVLLLVLVLVALGELLVIVLGPRRAEPPASQPPPVVTRPASEGQTPGSGQSNPPVSPSPGAAGATVPLKGELLVQTEPAGAQISVDGRRVGVSPVTVPELDAGDHEVTIRGTLSNVRQRVRVDAGKTTSLVVPLGTNRPTGSLSLRSPVELRVFEGDRLVGTSQMESLTLEAGTHRLVLVNEEIGFRGIETATVAAGKTTSLDVKLPEGRIAINAAPWAEVWIDGTRVGETPLGNVAVAVGPHQVRLRHPDLGEKTAAVIVKVDEKARLSVDMRK
jgi:hypothetical protein